MLMLKTVIRNILKRPATRKYPLVKRDPFANYRGRLINHVETCIFCRLCSNKCPSQCISTDPKEAFWGYDPFSCVYCGICVESCPTKSLFMLSTHRAPVPTKFVVYHKGTARVARPRLSSIPKPGSGESHPETPPAKVVAATEQPAPETPPVPEKTVAIENTPIPSEKLPVPEPVPAEQVGQTEQVSPPKPTRSRSKKK